MRFEAVVRGQSARVEVRGKNGNYVVTIDGRPLQVDYEQTGRHFASLLIDGRSYEAGIERRPGGYNVVLADDVLEVELLDAARGDGPAPRATARGPARLSAPMPGKVVRVLVQPGQEVQAGQGLVVMEAMKMENELRAPRPGKVAQVLVREQQAVDTGVLLVVIE